MVHFVGCGVLVADNEFWVLRSASPTAKNRKTRRRKARDDCIATGSQRSPSHHAALKQKQVFFYSGAQNTVTGKVRPRTQRPKEEQRYSSTLSLTSGIDRVYSQCYAPTALPAGKRRGTQYTEGWVGSKDQWTVAENIAQLKWNYRGEKLG